jgi:hypothetical protein
MIFSVRSVWGEVIHQVEVGDRKMQILGSIKAPHWIDLRGLDFTNANLRGADLQGPILRARSYWEPISRRQTYNALT